MTVRLWLSGELRHELLPRELALPWRFVPDCEDLTVRVEAGRGLLGKLKYEKNYLI